MKMFVSLKNNASAVLTAFQRQTSNIASLSHRFPRSTSVEEGKSVSSQGSMMGCANDEEEELEMMRACLEKKQRELRRFQGDIVRLSMIHSKTGGRLRLFNNALERAIIKSEDVAEDIRLLREKLYFMPNNEQFRPEEDDLGEEDDEEEKKEVLLQAITDTITVVEPNKELNMVTTEETIIVCIAHKDDSPDRDEEIVKRERRDSDCSVASAVSSSSSSSTTLTVKDRERRLGAVDVAINPVRCNHSNENFRNLSSLSRYVTSMLSSAV